ncbi:MAG: Gfo/Idh/MocA family oxidoreductase [Lewinellaceae bacterium]|nr:Gfo/Idh/MocA family oxidoreductase [Lewinellaceae bacterium]MCB9290245.1 Gfo/Idh/MocA family oxidoreductase [Lewinellaceae bacterium]
MKRRRFLRQTSAAAAGMGLAGMLPVEFLAANRKKISPNEKLGVAVIGCNGMGWTNMTRHFMVDGVECVALCDVDQRVLEKRAAEAQKIQGKAPRLYGDYRKLLEDKDVEAVIIGTPDHWHCLMMVDAVQAGKHVYVEKPIANSIKECRIMMAAGKKYGKVVQVGQWQRSGSHYEDAIAYVRSGKLGKIRLVKAWAYQGWMNPVPILPDSAPPEGVDYSMWLGPAPKRPFNPNRFHFNFRWFWDYAGGLMTDWGVHEIDIALYAMQAKAPKSVMASGGKLAYPDDASETPDTLQAVFEYDGFNMLWEHATGIDNGNYGRTEGIAFIGNHATLVVNRQGWEVIPETQREGGITKYEVEAFPKQEIGRGADYIKDHAQNFVDAIRANDPGLLKCGIETGGIAAINAHMGNIAFKTGRKVYWDNSMGLFKNDKEASSLISREYHNDWELPKL